MTVPPPAPRPALLAKPGSWLRTNAAELFACVVAVGWFYYLGYGPTLWPTDIDWMYRDDWSAYLWGWQFFRNSAWSWPLGATPELFWPFGTSVAFTDANPLAALLFRVFSPLLPLDFQFSGMWFLLCFVLQGYFGARLSASFTDDKVRQALGGCLFALTPLLPSRAPHIALSGFFFVTAGVYLNVKPIASRAEAKTLLVTTLLMVTWVAGTHGYLSVMLLVLALAVCARVWTLGFLRGWQALAAGASMVGVTVVVYYALGLIGWKEADLTAEGFGQFSGDLTTFFNPQGWSRWVPHLPHRPRQWEGFSYLGLGVFVLLAMRIVQWLIAPRRTWASLRSSWPLLLALLFMWFYSLSSSIALYGDEVYNLNWLYDPFARLTGIFRSSGRFNWPLHLALVGAAVAATCAIRNRWVGRTLLLAAVLLQGAEIQPNRAHFIATPLPKLEHPAWQTVRDHYVHLETVPLHLLWVCRYDARFIDRISYEAYRRKLTLNSGNVMRKEPNPQRLCERHLGPETAIDAQTIYVVSPEYLADFVGRKMVCGRIDGLIACVAERNESALLEALKAARVL